MSAQLETVECDKCGADIELSDSWTRKSIPLVGSEIEAREFLCPDCGAGLRMERAEGDDEWERGT